MKTKSQMYSDAVFKIVNDYIHKENDDKIMKKYKSLCKRSGGILRTVGLIQFLTFLKAKSVKEVQHGFLLEHLTNELSKFDVVEEIGNNSNNLLTLIRKQQLPEYMFATKEVLKLLQWHKRIADILIEGTVDDNMED